MRFKRKKTSSACFNSKNENGINNNEYLTTVSHPPEGNMAQNQAGKRRHENVKTGILHTTILKKRGKIKEMEI